MANTPYLDRLRRLTDKLGGGAAAVAVEEVEPDAPTATAESLDALTVPELRAMLESQGSSLAGNKSDLVARLLEDPDDEPDMEPDTEPRPDTDEPDEAPDTESEPDDEEDDDEPES